MANEKDDPLIISPANDIVVPDAEALAAHGGMSLEAAGLATGKGSLYEFGLRRIGGKGVLGPEFRSAVLIGGAAETPDLLGTPPLDSKPGVVYKAGALVMPTDEEFAAIRTGTPLKITR